MKAVLVLDIPDDLFEYYGNFYEQFYVECDLRAKHKYEMVDKSLGWIKECSLKPLPKKKGKVTLTERTQDIDMLKWQLETNLITKGWNDCLDEIEGERK